MRIWIPCLPAVLLGLLLPALASGQLIRVTPGYIRAPFVRVYRTPEGTRVRAPFVDVQAPDSRFAPGPSPPYLPGPLAPGEVQELPGQLDVTSSDWRTLRQIARAGLRQLDGQLDRYSTASIWKEQLKLGRLRELIAEDDNEPPRGPARDGLQEVLEAFNKVGLSPATRSLTELQGFQTVHTSLAELLMSPLQRQRVRLVTSALRLEESLGDLQYGERWAEYLRLPNSVVAPVPVDGQAGVVGTPDSQSQLANLLSRFDSLQADPRYRVITRLAAFNTTRQHLSTFLTLLEPAASPEELLPPPAAVTRQTELEGGP